MNHPDDFQYGPLARATYIALLWVTWPMGMYFPDMQVPYLLLLVFLGIGLKPLLTRTGLYRWYSDRCHKLDERRYRKLIQERHREVESAKVRTRHKQRRQRDPNLPWNW